MKYKGTNKSLRKSLVFSVKYIYLFPILLLGFLLIPVSPANCDSEGCLLSGLDPENAAKCIVSIEADLVGTNSLDKKHIRQFVEGLLETDMDSLIFMHERIVDIISLLKSSELIDAYVEYIIKLNASDQKRKQIQQEALAKLYVLEMPSVQKCISSKSKEDKYSLIESLACGMESYFFPHINKANFRRKMVGEYWELLETPSYPKLQTQIEAAVLSVITGEKNRSYNKTFHRTK